MGNRDQEKRNEDEAVVRRAIDPPWQWSCECGAVGGTFDDYWTEIAQGHAHQVQAHDAVEYEYDWRGGVQVGYRRELRWKMRRPSC